MDTTLQYHATMDPCRCPEPRAALSLHLALALSPGQGTVCQHAQQLVSAVLQAGQLVLCSSNIPASSCRVCWQGGRWHRRYSNIYFHRAAGVCQGS